MIPQFKKLALEFSDTIFGLMGIVTEIFNRLRKLSDLLFLLAKFAGSVHELCLCEI